MRGKIFMQIIAFISVGDLIGNFPYLFPYRPHTGSWWCYIQGFMNLAGYPMEWTWTVALVLLLYNVAVYHRPIRRLWPLYCICWGLPIIFALVQLSFGPYQYYGGYGEVCSITDDYSSEIYHYFTYYGLLIICVLFMILLWLKMTWLEFQYSQGKEESSAGDRKPLPFSVAKRALQWYPIILVVFWLPHAATVITYSTPAYVYNTFVVWKVFHGTVTALIFFYQSQESRRLWYQFCQYHFPLLFGNKQYMDDSVRETGESVVAPSSNAFSTINMDHSTGVASTLPPALSSTVAVKNDRSQKNIRPSRITLTDSKTNSSVGTAGQPNTPNTTTYQIDDIFNTDDDENESTGAAPINLDKEDSTFARVSQYFNPSFYRKNNIANSNVNDRNTTTQNIMLNQSLGSIIEIPTADY
jgi:hypothetical protein